MDALYTVIDGYIDFEGQKLADNINNYLLVLVGAIAFIVGFVAQDITLTVYIGLAGTALTALIVIPPWPFYNKKPLTWIQTEKPLDIKQEGEQ